jgi:hypothetical protein
LPSPTSCAPTRGTPTRRLRRPRRRPALSSDKRGAVPHSTRPGFGRRQRQRRRARARQNP